jgi:hypothetical protein
MKHGNSLINIAWIQKLRFLKIFSNEVESDGESGALSSGSNTGKKLKKSSRSNRTTRMLLTVVFLFILTNTPQGILSVLSGLIDKFFHNV